MCTSDFSESCDQLNEMGLSAPDVMEPGFLFTCLKPWPGTWLLFFTTQFIVKWRFPGSYGDAQRCGMPSTWWASFQFTRPLVLTGDSICSLTSTCMLPCGRKEAFSNAWSLCNLLLLKSAPDTLFHHFVFAIAGKVVYWQLGFGLAWLCCTTCCLSRAEGDPSRAMWWAGDQRGALVIKAVQAV